MWHSTMVALMFGEHYKLHLLLWWEVFLFVAFQFFMLQMHLSFYGAPLSTSACGAPLFDSSSFVPLFLKHMFKHVFVDVECGPCSCLICVVAVV